MKKWAKFSSIAAVALFLLLFFFVPVFYFPFSSFELARYKENSTFLFNGNTFQEYLADAKRRIERAKADPRLERPIQEQLVSYNSPFELLPDERFKVNGKYKKSIILFHGLWDSPFFFHDIAPYFQKKGFLVRAVLLPGMGAHPVDAMDTTYEEWLKMGRAIYKITEKDADEIYFGGFSTGAPISQALVLEGFNVKGLFFFSPGSKVANPLAPYAGVLKHVLPFLNHRPMDFYRYGSQASAAVYQYVRLYKHVLKGLKKKQNLDVPIFSALSLDDMTIDQNDTLKNILPHYTGKKKILIFAKLDAPKKIDGSFVYINSYKNGVLGLGHTSLPISPNNEYLGSKTGRLSLLDNFYPSFFDVLFHNTKNQKNLDEILSGNYLLGSRTKENVRLAEKPLVNISYNADFDEMIKEMNLFIDEIE